MIHNFEEMYVWQKAMQLVREVYRLVKLLPKEETYALSDQMRRAAISIPSNIAEGQQRGSVNEFIHFLTIAKGSSGELLTQLIICNQLNYLTKDQTTIAVDLTKQINKMLYSLITTLRNGNY